MKSTREKVSYCIGLQMGLNLKNQFTDMDLGLVKEGFQDALNGTPARLSTEEIHNVMNTLRQQMEVQQRQQIAKLAEQNKKSGEEFLSENKKKEGIITLASGLQYAILNPGHGSSPTLFDVVTAHYKGTFIDGREFEN